MKYHHCRGRNMSFSWHTSLPFFVLEVSHGNMQRRPLCLPHSSRHIRWLGEKRSRGKTWICYDVLVFLLQLWRKYTTLIYHQILLFTLSQSVVTSRNNSRPSPFHIQMWHISRFTKNYKVFNFTFNYLLLNNKMKNKNIWIHTIYIHIFIANT